MNRVRFHLCERLGVAAFPERENTEVAAAGGERGVVVYGHRVSHVKMGRVMETQVVVIALYECIYCPQNP